MTYEFGDFALDTRRCELSRAGESQHLEPQVYAVLCHLIEHRDRVVTRDELLDRVWGHRFITPATLNTRIKSLRHALDDDGATQHVIRTVRGLGFRFVCNVSVEGVESMGPQQAAGAAGDALRDVVDAHAASSSGAPVGRVVGGPAARASRPDATQQIRFCRAHDGVRIAYATSGAGPPLVKPANWLTHLEHDWNSPVWRHWLNELGRTHTLIRYDERGCGLSDHDITDFSFDSWVADLEAVVDAQRLERFSLLGISQGCAVAVAYAARHPERVDRLVLYGGYACGRNHRPNTAQQEIEAAVLRSLIRVGWGRANPAFRQVFGALFLPEGTAEQRQWFDDLTRTVPMENALRIQETTHDIDVRAPASTLSAPALVLHARGDAMIPLENGRCLAAAIPNARFVLLDSNNHVLLEQEPAWTRFLAEVRAFLGVEVEADGVRDRAGLL